MSSKTSLPVINIIAKNPYGETFFVESIEYKASKYKSMDDIRRELSQKLKWPKAIICEYDKNTQEALLVYDAHKKDGKIDWRAYFEEIGLDEVFAATSKKPVTIIAVCYKEAPGLGDEIGEVLNLVEFIKILAYIFVAFYYFIRPFSLLDKKYNVNENFVCGTIRRNRKWKSGFISADNFRFKWIVERSIMQKIGYKKIGKEWVSTIERPYMLPQDIAKENY